MSINDVMNPTSVNSGVSRVWNLVEPVFSKFTFAEISGIIFSDINAFILMER